MISSKSTILLQPFELAVQKLNLIIDLFFQQYNKTAWKTAIQYYDWRQIKTGQGTIEPKAKYQSQRTGEERKKVDFIALLPNYPKQRENASAQPNNCKFFKNDSTQFEQVKNLPVIASLQLYQLLLQLIRLMDSRKDRIQNIKKSLRHMTVLSKNSLQIEAKELQIRTRRQSLQLADVLLSQKLLKRFSDEDQQEERSNLNSFNQKYKLRQKIGQGANAIVYTCEYLSTGKIYAVKIITMDEQHILELKRNFLSIRQLRHPSIIKYHALYFDLKKLVAYLIMEHFPYPNLTDLLPQNQKELKIIFARLFEAVNYIHQRNICHRDIKPQNILYDSQEQKVKLIDFGISKKTYQRGSRRDMLTIIGTSLYLAPQILLGGGYDQRVDIWSLGVTLYRMIAGFTPFQSEYHSDTVNNIIKGHAVFDQNIWSKFSFFVRDLVIRLLKNRDQRLTIKQAIKHLWLSQINCPPGEKQRRSSQNQQLQFKRHSTFNIKMFKVFHEEQVFNLKHATSKEEGEHLKIEQSKKIVNKKLHLLQNKEFDLQDSDFEDNQTSPSTVHSRQAILSRQLQTNLS